jgi:hypothetical protein
MGAGSDRLEKQRGIGQRHTLGLVRVERRGNDDVNILTTLDLAGKHFPANSIDVVDPYTLSRSAGAVDAQEHRSNPRETVQRVGTRFRRTSILSFSSTEITRDQVLASPTVTALHRSLSGRGLRVSIDGEEIARDLLEVADLPVESSRLPRAFSPERPRVHV